MSSNGVVRALPRKGDPLVLADGRIVLPDCEDGAAPVISIKDVAAPSEYRPLARRAFKDFAASPSSLRAISVMFVLTVLGISDREVVDELGLTQDKIDEIRSSPMYSEVFDAILNEFINVNSGLLQSRIQAYSHAALTKVAHLSANAVKEETTLAASKDLLDRAGARPADLAGKNASMSNELRITITKRSNDDIEISV